jgi:DNA-binding MarR family transcriptional regulator
MKAISNQISVLYRLSQVYIAKKLSVYGLNHSQISTLLFIGQRESTNQHEIAKFLSLDKGSVSSMIKKLLVNGFITKRYNPDDKRAAVINLSYKSSLLLDQLKETDQQLTRRLLKGFNGDEKKIVKNLLERMKENVGRLEEAHLQAN